VSEKGLISPLTLDSVGYVRILMDQFLVGVTAKYDPVLGEVGINPHTFTVGFRDNVVTFTGSLTLMRSGKLTPPVPALEPIPNGGGKTMGRQVG
jgi:hypothetical protein